LAGAPKRRAGVPKDNNQRTNANLKTTRSHEYRNHKMTIAIDRHLPLVTTPPQHEIVSAYNGILKKICRNQKISKNRYALTPTIETTTMSNSCLRDFHQLIN
jgi:hypothetical protein